MRNYGPGLLSYLLTGAVALAGSIVISVAFSGCYFGNREIDLPPTSWLYDTDPQAISYQVNSGSLISGKISALPAFVTSLMTDPVYIDLASSSFGNAVLLNSSNTGTQLPVNWNSDNSTLTQNGAIFVSGYTYDPSNFDPSGTTLLELGWASSATCPGTVELSVNGNGYSAVTSTAGSSGRLNLTFTVTERFDGSGCTALTQLLASCYENVNSCPGIDAPTQQANQSELVQMLEPWIAAGALASGTISSISSLTYIVTYN